MSRYVIYARKSTESVDRQVVSIESQVKELRLLATRQNIEVAEVLTESASAKQPGRPIFGALLRRIRRGEIRGILCWKMDRLARNHLDHGAILQTLADKLLEQIVTIDRLYTPDGTDRFTGNFELAMATKYSDDLSQNVRRGIRARLERGWINHQPKLGYLLDPVTKDVIKDPERFDTVERMLRLLLTGTMRPMVVLEIASTKWHLRTRKGLPLSRASLYAMLADPFYAGLIRLRDGRTYPGTHPPMITMAEHERIQDILGRTGRSRPMRHEFAFTGIFACGHCGGGITGEEHVKKSGKRYVYYRCSRRRAGVVCHEPPLSEPALIAQVARELRFLRVPEPIHQWLCRQALKATEDERDLAEQVRRTIDQAIENLGREESNLIDLRARELISEDVFLAKRQSLQGRRVDLAKRQREGQSPGHGEALVKVFTFAARAFDVLQKGTPVQQRMVLEAVGLNYTLKGRRVAFSLDKPLDRMVEAGGLSNWSGCLDDVRTWLTDTGPFLRLPNLTGVTLP